MRRLLVFILGILAASFGIASPAIASVAGPSNLEVIHVYAYDCHHHPAVPTSSTAERGPPDATYGYTTYDAVDPCSRGASARSGDPATRAIYGYDDLALLVQSARGSGNDAEEPVGSAEAGTVVVERWRVAANGADEFVDLASASRRSHVLDGEVRPSGSFGGGHRPGTGFPNKSEFPAGWSDDRIMHSISDVATDPSLIWRPGNKPGDFFVNGTRGGIDIEVLIRNNQIWTGYPTNVIRNAP